MAVKTTSQSIVEPEHLFFKAEREKQFITGSEAVKEAIKRANVDMAISYPITPQSESMHLVGDLYAQGYVKDYYRGENELGVMSAVAGASMGGVRVFTATGGQGSLRAFEMFPTWAGARLPVVCAFFCRGLNSPLTIQPDTIEIGLMLDTGMIILHAETAQDLYDMILKAFIIAEEPDVHLPIAVFADGFFVTHTREIVEIAPEDIKLPPYNPYKSPVPVMDMETPPVRQMRDPFVMKSNFISYATHASWQQEVRAAAERARKHINRYLGGLIETENEDADILFMTSGTAASQARAAIIELEKEGIKVGLVKIKSLRPFPTEDIRRIAKNKKAIIVPEFNITGWLAREIKAVVEDNSKVIGAPRVFGGMTMPVELLLDEIKKHL
ncbi:MAG: ferredoxin oxidoreductase [Candidatus Omnitrophica bacterium]|nr:ferredoxin oxidoreductase [Candidatus Omnitrophota bacterium]MBU0878523.1 ferredoxin oxidoreductase [Candidatus Omnitrophota bacterium]MBU1133452.1 ferredoxin oxidoreductase [Candidatus Omnitrophota bacterium]MBU1524190.1 ferredoxin oxidoreductase [Candidatus Omnitrophota bacterium]MBU1810495.1 ferredoxin oxidoreductase [Candidatus Omnitrophota bacterium]